MNFADESFFLSIRVRDDERDFVWEKVVTGKKLERILDMLYDKRDNNRIDCIPASFIDDVLNFVGLSKTGATDDASLYPASSGKKHRENVKKFEKTREFGSPLACSTATHCNSERGPRKVLSSAS